MSSSVDISAQTDEFLTFENIIASLLARLSALKGSVPQSSSSNNTTDNNSGSNDLNNDNTTIAATTTDNGHSLIEECLVTHGQFDKLQRDLYQIKEAFRKLKNFEHDAGESIKNIEFCLDDISKIVVEASNDAFPIQAKLSAIKKKDALKS
nr:hypothetical protein CFP56_25508 [Quercus suber]